MCPVCNYQTFKAGYTTWKHANSKNSIGTPDSVIERLKDSYDAAERRTCTGFIAQEVEQASKSIGYDFEGLHTPQNEKDNYSLAYDDFVPALVKAVQELSVKNDSLQSVNAAMQAQMQQVLSRLDQFESSLSQCCSNYQPASGAITNALNTPNNVNTDVAALEQNVPNPFNASTYIKFYLPSAATKGQLIITDMNGQTLRQYNIGGPGFGKQTIAPGEFAQGTYTYTLYVDGKMIDTKQMILTR